MNKKLLYLGLCLVSLFMFDNVKANSTGAKVCTDEDVKNMTLKLNIDKKYEGIPIKTLGRTYATGKTNMYAMSLTNSLNDSSKKSFCMNSTRHANSGDQYKYKYEIGNDTQKDKQYRVAYRFGQAASINSFEFFTAQAALWLTQNGMFGEGNLKNAVEDIVLSSNCEFYIRMLGGTTQDVRLCSDYINRDDPTTEIREKLKSLLKTNSKIQSLDEVYEDDVDKIVSNFMTAYNNGVMYEGKLYMWEAVKGDMYQDMLAPLDCDSDTSNKICYDSNGKAHDYTTEYNECVKNGGNKTVCNTTLKNKYCPATTSKKYTVKTDGSPAVCSNNSTNIGTYYDYVVENDTGTAIPGKGDNEKQINSYCNLYCIENNAQQIFPGNIKNSVSVGTYIIWPTSESTLSSKYKNQYPLSFNGQKTCYVVMSGEDNPVNTTDIDAAYKELNSKIKDEIGTYVKQNYSVSRNSEQNNCDSVYNPVCSSYEARKNNAYNSWQDYVNSKEYTDAVSSIEDKRKHNDEVDDCEDAARKTCESDCLNNKDRNCYSKCLKKNTCDEKESTKEEDKIINKGKDLETDYNTANDAYEACNAEKKACKNYADNVKKVEDFVNELKTCVNYTPECSGATCDIYNFTTNVNLSWGDSYYGTTITDAQLEKTKSYSSKIEYNSEKLSNLCRANGVKYSDTDEGKAECIAALLNKDAATTINNIKELVNIRKITADVGVTYSLPTTNLIYNYVIKRNNKYESVTVKPSSDSNFTTIGFSNLPISYDAKAGVSYELKLSDIHFGENGKYHQDEYTCNYNVTKTVPTDCLCPSESIYPGRDLSNIMIDEKLTCSDAQQKYCNVQRDSCPDGSKSEEMMICMNEYDWFTCYDKNCRISPNDKYCPNDPSINLSACLNNYDYDYCEKLLCNDNPDNPNNPNNPSGSYTCKNTNGVDGEMDITSCVYVKMAQGLSLDDAINTCDSLICPLSGLRIIYRTISLKNPFPGKTAKTAYSNQSYPKELTSGMFNTNVRGRYPGTNWNNIELVQKHILTVTRQGITMNNDEIYNNEPLYRFELNTSTINAIRNYNKTREANGGYADFTLDCKSGTFKACVSEFVHNKELSGLVGGVCMNSTSKTNFYSCSGDT